MHDGGACTRCCKGRGWLGEVIRPGMGEADKVASTKGACERGLVQATRPP